MVTTEAMTIATSMGDVPLTVETDGAGRAVVVLHGGAGPASVRGFARRLTGRLGVRTIVPTHPGFDGTPRPDHLSTIQGLAELYDRMLDALGLDEVVVLGNSIGGWITAELALRGSSRVTRLVFVDSVGIRVDGHPVASGLPPAAMLERTFFDPTKAPDPATLPPAAQAAMVSSGQALSTYAGDMTDPSLADRLHGIDLPSLVLWGEGDRIVDPDYGRAFAAAIPSARFALLPRTGHVSPLETPDELVDAIDDFVRG